MFYRLIKIIARGMLFFFARKKICCGYNLANLKGPAVIACNHPNSMMDAALIGCLCSQPVHFTIRSDMFRNKLFRFLLRFLNGIPLYRVSEERERLKENFTTFDACRKILAEKGIILIFSEGVTMHDWKLKPLKSGTYRMVAHAMENSELRETLQVLPVGLTYSSFTQLSKTIIVQAAEPFYPGKLLEKNEDVHPRLIFNEKLFSNLLPLVPCMTSEKAPNILWWQSILSNITVTNNCHSTVTYLHEQAKHFSETTITPDKVIRTEPFYISKNKKDFLNDCLLLLLLALPAIGGFLLNVVYYLPVVKWCRIKTRDTIFFDSLLFGIATITYPMYILFLAFMLHYITPVAWWIWLPAIPVTGWCALQANVKLQSIVHYAKRKNK
ncbi:MAG: 1-acyl-sn-glycerol-3-phosphate acyltransferase [Agriterribacter sp.]